MSIPFVSSRKPDRPCTANLVTRSVSNPRRLVLLGLVKVSPSNASDVILQETELWFYSGHSYNARSSVRDLNSLLASVRRMGMDSAKIQSFIHFTFKLVACCGLRPSCSDSTYILSPLQNLYRNPSMRVSHCSMYAVIFIAGLTEKYNLFVYLHFY